MIHIPGNKFKLLRITAGQNPKFKLGCIYDISNITPKQGNIIYTFRNLTEKIEFYVKFKSTEEADRFIERITK